MSACTWPTNVRKGVGESDLEWMNESVCNREMDKGRGILQKSSAYIAQYKKLLQLSCACGAYRTFNAHVSTDKLEHIWAFWVENYEVSDPDLQMWNRKREREGGGDLEWMNVCMTER